MAKTEKKKFKNMKLEQVELKATTIGSFESRKRSSIGIFIILSIFTLVIVFLPDISNIVESYLNPKPNVVIPSTPVAPVVPGEDEGEGNSSVEDSFYQFVENLKIANDDITVSSFLVDSVNNTLSYTVTNNGLSQNIEDLNYYIEIYNGERTLIERVKLASELVLTSGAFRKVTKNISNDAAVSIGYVVLVKKTIQEYPEANLEVLEDGSSSLVCSNLYEAVTYKFTEDKLKELTSIVTHKIDEVNYNTIYEEQKILVNNYSSKKGITSTMFEYEGGYNITTNVNLKEANRIYIFSADSFKEDTQSKVVKFEMEAQGFRCS